MHEPFIKQAMDGIMMQKTDFKIEVVVGDDFSTDRTLEIIKSYKNTESIDIKILKREKGDEYWRKRQKLGRLYNFTNILENCTGKYIALLDGDDYWTDSLKLQKQVDFLEGNPKYGICAHKAKQVSELDGSIKVFPNLKGDKSYTIKDFILANHIATCSILFKKRSYEYQDWLKKSPFGDWPLILITILNSNERLFVFNQKMSVYRIHSGGVHGKFHQNNYKLSIAYEQHFMFINLIEKYLLKGKFSKEVCQKKKITSKKIVSLLSLKKSLHRKSKFSFFYIYYTLKLRLHN
jgi:glycosyltransferase involved in cell wall biosynthesis